MLRWLETFHARGGKVGRSKASIMLYVAFAAVVILFIGSVFADAIRD